jgi:hypothetical protein
MPEIPTTTEAGFPQLVAHQLARQLQFWCCYTTKRRRGWRCQIFAIGYVSKGLRLSVAARLS